MAFVALSILITLGCNPDPPSIKEEPPKKAPAPIAKTIDPKKQDSVTIKSPKPQKKEQVLVPAQKDSKDSVEVKVDIGPAIQPLQTSVDRLDKRVTSLEQVQRQDKKIEVVVKLVNSLSKAEPPETQNTDGNSKTSSGGSKSSKPKSKRSGSPNKKVAVITEAHQPIWND